MRVPVAMLALSVCCGVALAQAPMAKTHTEIIQFVVSAGLSVCESVANDPPEKAKAQGAIAKHQIEVSKDCETQDPKTANVIFAFEFDNKAHRDAAVASFVQHYEASFVDFASAWSIGERGAIFVSGPAREGIGKALQAEYARRAKAAGG